MSSYSDAVLASSPMLYFRFNDTSGVVTDSSGNARHGSVVGAGVSRGAPRIGPRDAGASGYACRFSATSAAAYIQTPITVLPSVLTFELMFVGSSSQTASNGYLIGKNRFWANTAAELPLSLVYTGSQLAWRVDQGNDYNYDGIMSCPAAPDTPHLVHAIYRSGGVCELWLNGVQAGSFTLTGAAASNSLPIMIGGAQELSGGIGNTTFIGRIDEVAIYGAALSESLIKSRQALRYVGSDLAGNVTTTSGAAAENVVVWDWASKALVTTVRPAANGDWSCGVPPGDYGLTYLAAGSQPVTHGPYQVAA